MRVATTLTAMALAFASTLAGVQLASSGPARADEYTVSQNLSRDGWDSDEPLLSPAAVSGTGFGKIFETPVNGQVFAQPLNVGDSVLVATENDYVYSINRNTGAVNWSRQLGSPYASATEGCQQTPVVLPYIGVTSAPVYDPSTGTLYVSGMISGPPGDDTDMSTPTPAYDLFALDEKTGAIKWSKQISGSPANNPAVTFDAAVMMQRPGLLLLNGSVYLGFGALCPDGAANHQYVGYVAGVNTTSHAQTLWTDQPDDPNLSFQYGGIWQGGGGLVSDGKSIYFATGNGQAPPLGTAGTAAPTVGHLAQSMVRLDVGGDGSLQAADFFSPGDAAAMTSVDHDFGSGGPILLPFTTSAYPDGLFATADKEAVIYLLDKDSLGGSSSSATGSTAVYTAPQSLVNDPSTNVIAHGLWGHMAAAAFAGTGSDGLPNDYIYYEGTGWGSTDNMYALKFDGSNASAPVLDNVGATTQSYGFSSGSPVITSNGTDPASGIVWEVYAPDISGAHGSLDAYSALPVNGVLQQIWTAPIGNASQFSLPATSGGRVYVGARNDGTAATTGSNATACPTDFESASYTSTDSACVGEVYGFGVFSAQLAGSTVNLGQVALGRTATKMVTLANTGDTSVRITKVTTPTVPFGTPAGPALNTPIAAGASVSFPATFTPQARGATTGTYTVTTTDGFSTRTTTVSVTGTGVAAASGVSVVPSPGGGWTLNGSARMTGTVLRLNPAVKNTSGSAVYYQRLPGHGLNARFTARLSGGTGADGLTFALLDPAKSTVSSLGAGGQNLGFGGLSGVAVVLGTHKSAGDPSGNFIGIATGMSNGHLAFAATSTKVPNLRATTHVIGVSVSAGTASAGTITVTVNGTRYLSAAVKLPASVLPAFTAASGGLDDIHAVAGVVISAPGTGGALPAPGGGWSFNGTAAMTGATASLTQAVVSQAGAVVYPHTVHTASFSTTFNVTLSGGSGGTGMTLALLNPASKMTSVGSGQGFGFAGLNGLAVVLGTQKIGGAPSADFVGIEKGTAGGATSLLAAKALTSALRTGTHTVTVSLRAGTLTVTLDGSAVLSHSVTTLVSSSALVAFTGGTATLTDRHLVQNAAISAG